jgi:hypothetical protein
VLEQLRHGSSGFFSGLLHYQFWADMLALMLDLGKELWVGCLIIGLLLAIPTYLLTRRGVGVYRARRAKRLLDRQALLAERRRQRALKRSAKVVVTPDAA